MADQPSRSSMEGANEQAESTTELPEEGVTELPEEGVVRINVDAAFSEDGLRVGIGFGVWMHDGLYVRRHESLDHPLAPHSAEAYAIRAAVHWAVLQGWDKIQVFTDCLSLVSSFNRSDFEFSLLVQFCQTLVG